MKSANCINARGVESLKHARSREAARDALELTGAAGGQAKHREIGRLANVLAIARAGELNRVVLRLVRAKRDVALHDLVRAERGESGERANLVLHFIGDAVTRSDFHLVDL